MFSPPFPSSVKNTYDNYFSLFKNGSLKTAWRPYSHPDMIKYPKLMHCMVRGTSVTFSKLNHQHTRHNDGKGSLAESGIWKNTQNVTFS